MNRLIVIGNGKLADAILNNYTRLSGSSVAVGKYLKNSSADPGTVFIHTGSGRQYRESLDLAVLSGAAYIQAATEKNIKLKEPDTGKIVFISSPNLDLNIIRFFRWLRLGKNLFRNEEISVTESHQESKSSLPGTALKICSILGIDESKLVSIRDPELQKKLGIKNLEQHAYHKIEIGNSASLISLETRIEGLLTYVKGLIKIVKIIPELQKKNYEIEDLLEYNLL